MTHYYEDCTNYRQGDYDFDENNTDDFAFDCETCATKLVNDAQISLQEAYDFYCDAKRHTLKISIRKDNK